jgi:rhodanese-related sulfurtransferase
LEEIFVMTARMRHSRPRELYRDELEALAFHYHLAVLDTREDVGAFAREHLLRSVYAPMSQSVLSTVVSKLTPSIAAIALVVERQDVDDAFAIARTAGASHCVGWATPETLGSCREEVRASFEAMSFDEAVEAHQNHQVSLVDVRSVFEAAASPLKRGNNITYDRFLARRNSPPPGEERPWCFYSPDGVRAATAASWLLRDGHKAVWIQERPAARLAWASGFR